MSAAPLSSSRFPPTRAAALQRLSEFVPKAGAHYAAHRNTDYGPDKPASVSCLSPYLRYRMITEEETVRAVLARYSYNEAEKFLQEVLWRTYWKGWLEMRPEVWLRYQRAHDALRVSHHDHDLLRAAEAGETGIEGFDEWAKELVETGYLHNHARMWFASIWIFTLNLPWVLGADFFLRHLLDADAASNTLSWRWVAGLQTPGKTYLATRENIARYTAGRFAPHGLAKSAEPLVEPPLVGATPLPPIKLYVRDEPAILLLHSDDLHPESLLDHFDNIKDVFLVNDRNLFWGNKTYEFITASYDELAIRVGKKFDQPLTLITMSKIHQLIDCAKKNDIKQIIVPYAPQGLVASWINALDDTLSKSGLSLRFVRRRWDDTFWPHATRGFFPFKEHIPALLRDLGSA